MNVTLWESPPLAVSAPRLALRNTKHDLVIGFEGSLLPSNMSLGLGTRVYIFRPNCVSPSSPKKKVLVLFSVETDEKNDLPAQGFQD